MSRKRSARLQSSCFGRWTGTTAILGRPTNITTFDRRSLGEEGRRYGDVEIPFFKDNENIVDLRARTIRPDGSMVNFDGKVYEKEIVKARGIKYLAKTFTLSDVQPFSCSPSSAVSFRRSAPGKFPHTPYGVGAANQEGKETKNEHRVT